MSRNIVGTARIRDAAGVLVLDLNSGPYVLAAWSDDEEARDRQVNESPWVDGDDEPGPGRLLSTVIEVSVRVKAATWADVELAAKALRDAAKAAPVWLLEREIEGVSHVWRANPPLSITSPVFYADIANRRRTVTMRVPVQPSPVITFPEEP